MIITERLKNAVEHIYKRALHLAMHSHIPTVRTCTYQVIFNLLFFCNNKIQKKMSPMVRRNG